jgi:hypothetical protein
MLWGILIQFLLIILIIYFANHILKTKSISFPNKNFYSFLLKEDTISEFFFLLSLLFLALTLLIFNKNLEEPVKWQSIIFLVALFSFTIGYYYKVILSLILSLVSFIIWWWAQSVIWIQDEGIKFTSFIAGLIFICIIFYLVGRIFNKNIGGKNFSGIYLVTGTSIFLTSLLLVSSIPGIYFLEVGLKGQLFLKSLRLTFWLLTFVLSIIGMLIYAIKKKILLKFELIMIGFILLIICSLLFIPEGAYFLQKQAYRGYEVFKLTKIGLLIVFISYILPLMVTISLIIGAIFNKNEVLEKIGIIFLLLLLIIRWIEWLYYSLDIIPLSLLGGLLFLSFGLIIYLLIKILKREFEFEIDNKAYIFFGLTPLVIFLSYLSSKDAIAAFDFNIQNSPLFSYFAIVTLIYFLSSLFISLYYLIKNENISKEITFLLTLLFVLIFIFFAPIHTNLVVSYNRFTNLGIFWLVIFNILLILVTLGIIILGYLRKNELFINFGMLITFLLIIFKYYDWLYGSLTKRIFVIGVGILFLLAGWLMEKWRRHMISTIKSENLIEESN